MMLTKGPSFYVSGACDDALVPEVYALRCEHFGVRRGPREWARRGFEAFVVKWFAQHHEIDTGTEFLHEQCL